jgi:hypothetical protein
MNKIRKRDTVILKNGKIGLVLNEATISDVRILEVEIVNDKQIEYVQDSNLTLQKQWFWNFVLNKFKLGNS